MIGSLLVGRECRRKMLAEGFNEVAKHCPLCHQQLPEGSKMSVKDGQVVLESVFKSLDEFSEHSKFTPPAQGPATFKLLSVEVIHEDGSVTPLSIDEKREGKGHDGKTANSGTDEGRRRNGAENVDGAGRSDRKADDTEVLHRGEEPPSDSPEDA